MANRTFHELQSLDRAVVWLFGVVTFGGSGAVSSVDANGFTVTKPSGTGLYRITLDDKYNALFAPSLTLYNGGTAADAFVQLHAELSSSTIFDVKYVAAGAEANATSGHKLYVAIPVRNSNVPRKGL